jgi:integrase/recombinase XerD
MLIRSETTMQIYDSNGRRKYLTPTERQDFIRASQACLNTIRTFCGTLVHTGCRISEALALTTDRVDMRDGVLIFESLKKRRRGIYRAVPVPPTFLDALAEVHNLRAVQNGPDAGRSVPLWPWSRPTGWRYVRSVMETAGIAGLHASPKGLRHGFGIKAVVSNVPLNMTQKWLGHSQLATTAIYANATGPEEKQLAERMWE